MDQPPRKSTLTSRRSGPHGINRGRGQSAHLPRRQSLYFLEAHPRFPRVLNQLFAEVEARELNAITSELTLAEVLVKPLQDRNSVLESLCFQFICNRGGLRVRPVDKQILVEAARIRAVHGLRLPDAIHIATALDTGCQVLLTNDRRLRKVGDLEVFYLDQYAET